MATSTFYIIDARSLPLIDMLEKIRAMLMERIHVNLRNISRKYDIIYPRIRKQLEMSKFMTKNCTLKCVVGDTFEASIRDDRFIVDLNKKLCSCRE